MKKFGFLNLGLVIIFTAGSLAGCVPGSGTSSSTLSGINSSSSTNPESQDRQYELFGGLKIRLDGDAKRLSDSQISVRKGSVYFSREGNSPETSIEIITPTGSIIITPRGTIGYVKINETFNRIGCIEGLIDVLSGPRSVSLEAGDVLTTQRSAFSSVKLITSSEINTVRKEISELDECYKNPSCFDAHSKRVVRPRPRTTESKPPQLGTTGARAKPPKKPPKSGTTGSKVIPNKLPQPRKGNIFRGFCQISPRC